MRALDFAALTPGNFHPRLLSRSQASTAHPSIPWKSPTGRRMYPLIIENCFQHSIVAATPPADAKASIPATCRQFFNQLLKLARRRVSSVESQLLDGGTKLRNQNQDDTVLLEMTERPAQNLKSSGYTPTAARAFFSVVTFPIRWLIFPTTLFGRPTAAIAPSPVRTLPIVWFVSLS
jgi:hypothetical protein